jgi:regulatory protein
VTEPPAGTDRRALDPEARRQHALEVAWTSLGRRERTEAELRGILERKRIAPELAAEVVGQLRDEGYVDDAGYARRFAEDRRRLDGWGAERIERRLRSLGIAREHVAAALAGQDGDAELEAAVALLERRFAAPPEGPRDRERALGMLVRKGYELDLAHDALRRHANASAD